MNAERWKQIDELVDEALDLPEDGRVFFVTVKCGEDRDLKEQVLKLLDAQKDSDKFMQNSAMNLMAKAIAEDDTTVFQNSLYNRTLGNYRIEKILGAGGMGEVYLAHDQKLDRKVALKILPKEFHADDERVKRFEIEARAIAVLNHPNIVTIYDFGHIENVNYIATEFVEGKTVRDIMGEKPPLKEILSIILQATDALSAAHSAGIIHRDIKPENIMVRPDGYVKILDFGLAKLTESEQKKSGTFDGTMKGAIIGTPAYMSPEQASGDFLDHRTDLWSIGLVLYEMVTGKNPFKKDSRQATLQAVLNEDPPFASNFKPEIPAELDQILVKALEKDADLSYQTASDFRADLKRVKREIDSSPSMRSAGGDSLMRRREDLRTRKPFLLFTCVLLLFILLGGVIVWLTYFGDQVEPSPWNNAIATQLTDFAGEESYPSISPDGKTLLYVRAQDGNKDIFRQRIGGSNPQNLTTDSSFDDTQPAFSPNGEQIAFRSNRNGGGIFVMGATGEAVKRLTDFGFTPAWSPDGKEIVFSTIDFEDPISRSRTGELWLVDLNGTTRQINLNVDATQPYFSPDGKRIVFWGKDEKYQRDLWTVAVEGGDAVRLTNDDALDWNPVWSPDGKFIYFCSNRNGGASLWRIQIDQITGKPLAEPEAISAPLAQSWLLTISKDGKNLVYVRRTRIENIQQIEFDPAKMQIVGKPDAITEGNKRTRTPDVSPDGSLITFYVTGETQEDIIMVKNGETKWNLLTNDPARDRVPRFSPDGSRIAFYSNLGGTYEIYTIKPDGTDRRQLTNFGGKGIYYPIFSPDGKRLAYTVLEGATQLIELESDWAKQTPFQVPPLNEKNENFVAWSWSPDGKKIAGWRSDNVEFELSGVYQYLIETNSYEKISETAERPTWLSDSRNLLATQDGKLFVLDSQTKTQREILSLLPLEISSPAVTKDNRRIVFSLMTIEADIQMLSLE